MATKVSLIAAVVGIALSVASSVSAKPRRAAPAPFTAATAGVERTLPKMKKIEASLEHMGGEGAEGTAWFDGQGRVRKMLLTLYGERGRSTEMRYLDEQERHTLVLTQYERYREQVGHDTSIESTEWCLFRFVVGTASDGTCIDDRGRREIRTAKDYLSLESDILAQFHDAVIFQQIERIARARGAELTVEFKVISIVATFPIDDMPEGFNRWHLTGEVLKCQVGSCSTEPVGTRFDVDVEIYDGPVRKRPTGLWVNTVPPVGSTWVAFFRTWSQSIKPLFAGKAEQALLTIARDELSRP